MEGILKLIKNISQYASLTTEEQDFLVSYVQYKKIAKNDFLLKPGQVCFEENYIIKGCLGLYALDDCGVEHYVYVAVDDWWISDLVSLEKQIPSNVYIIAIENTEVLQLERKNIELLYKNIPIMERFFRKLYRNALISYQIRTLERHYLTAEERYLKFRSSYPFIENKLYLKQVASYLGIAPESLSRIRRNLATQK